MAPDNIVLCPNCFAERRVVVPVGHERTYRCLCGETVTVGNLGTNDADVFKPGEADLTADEYYRRQLAAVHKTAKVT